MAKKKLTYGSKKLVIDMGKIRDEFAHLGFIPDERLTEGAITKMVEDTANDLIKQLNKKSSMRATQGAGDSYFTNPSINRAVYDQPFSSAEVKSVGVQGSEFKTTISAPLTSTGGDAVDLIDVIQSGRPKRQLPKGKRVLFPATQKGSERLIKKRLGSANQVSAIFRSGKARYKKRDGKLMLVSLNYVPEIQGRDILGVIARDIERQLAKEKISIPSLGISSNIGKGLIKVEVDE